MQTQHLEATVVSIGVSRKCQQTLNVMDNCDFSLQLVYIHEHLSPKHEPHLLLIAGITLHVILKSSK